MKCNLWSHHYLHICWLNILLLDRQGTALPSILYLPIKMAGNRITNMLILKMAIADLLVTISVMPFSVLFWVGGEVDRRTFWRNFLQNRSLFTSNVHTSFDFYCHVSFDWSLFRCNVPNETMSITKNQMTCFCQMVLFGVIRYSFHDLVWDQRTRWHLRLLTLFSSPQ